MRKILSCVFVLLFVLSANAAAQNGNSCESLAKLSLTNAKVTSATMVGTGAFTPPAAGTPWLAGDPDFYKTLPAFCRVTVTATPSADSDIKIEVWLPESGWNGKFQGNGNGGFAGEIDYGELARRMSHGYATANTDTGHAAQGTDARWALGHPEKVVDFGHRAVHEMTVVGKAVTTAYFGSGPKHNYFAGCSNGGRQALMEAQRYPADYDGILAGAPANYWTHLLSAALYNAKATTVDPASYIPMSKLPAIAHAVVEACDAKDGVKDGILNDPRQCRFEAKSMLCKSGDSESCLTEKQAIALEKLYAGPVDSHGHRIFPGYLPGGEEGGGGWGVWITGQEPGKSLIFAFGNGYFSNILYGDANWNYKTANFDQAVADADNKSASILNATDSDLQPFTSRGGKLLMYHGWDDAAISAVNSVNYYSEVMAKLGAKEADASVRLYMLPGVQHCAGGPGPDAFGEPGTPQSDDSGSSVTAALERWVEKGTAPSQIIATKYAEGQGPVPDFSKPKMTRPLCPYPQIATYKGTGDTNDAANFACGAPTYK
jgi:hypothetical protein